MTGSFPDVVTGASIRRFGFSMFLLKALVVILLLGGGISVSLYQGYQKDVAINNQQQLHYVSQLEDSIDSRLSLFRNDLELLAQSPALLLYLQHAERVQLDLVQQTFLALSGLRRDYDQVRFIDRTGSEMIRVNREGSISYLVSDTDLQHKSHRDYVQIGLNLPQGKTYISALDLNLENNQIEIPFKPVLRLVTPVHVTDELQGVVVLNASASQLLYDLQMLLPQGQEAILVNADGYWLMGGAERDWQFMFDGATGQLVEDAALWQRLKRERVGRFELAGECYTYRWYSNTDRDVQVAEWLIGARETGRSCDALAARYQKEGIYLLLAGAVISLPLLGMWHRSRQRYRITHDQLLANERQLRLITNEAGQGLIMVDSTGVVRWINQEAERLLGWTEAELMEHDLHRMIHVTTEGQVLHKDECLTFKTIRTGVRHHHDHDFFRTCDDRVIPVSVTVTPLHGHSHINGAIISFSDSSSFLERETELQQQATTDELTGILNRRATLQHLKGLKESVVNTPGVIMLDIDHFKQVNDLYGHGVGDQALIHFCNTVTRLLRKGDLFGRIGGEEFLVILGDVQPEDLRQLAERIRETLAMTPLMLKQGPMPLTASLGIALPHEDESVDGLLARADQALYRAKQDGRNRVEWAV